MCVSAAGAGDGDPGRTRAAEVGVGEWGQRWSYTQRRAASANNPAMLPWRGGRAILGAFSTTQRGVRCFYL